MKWIASITVFLFCSGYWICDAIFTNGIESWWRLRLAIYSLIFSLCFFVAYKLTTGFTKAIFLTGIIFCLGDIADRYLFNINEFHFNDLMLYLFAIFYLTKTHYAGQTKRPT
jgi:hypothetical protein